MKFTNQITIPVISTSKFELIGKKAEVSENELLKAQRYS